MMYIIMNPVLFLVKSLTTDIFPLCKSAHIKSVLISFAVNIPGISVMLFLNGAITIFTLSLFFLVHFPPPFFQPVLPCSRQQNLLSASKLSESKYLYSDLK